MSLRITGEVSTKVGDTLKPWSVLIEQIDGDDIVDLEDYDTVEFHAVDDLDGETCPLVDLVAWTDTNVTVQPAKAFTIDAVSATENTIYCKNHGLASKNVLKFTVSGGTLPTQLMDYDYWFVQRVNGPWVWVSHLKAGQAVNITDDGAGTYNFALCGHVQYQPQAADVDTALSGGIEVRLDNGGDVTTLPGPDGGGAAKFIQLYIVGDRCD